MKGFSLAYKIDAFGSQMPGRTWVASDYRFGFNDKEKDNELYKGAQNYGFRMNDERIGRFFSTDRLFKKFPNLSPYQFASNRPIQGIDAEGLEFLTYQILIKDGGATVMKVIDHTKTMTDARIEQVWHMTAEEFYKKYSKSFESKGQGVLYEYFLEDSNGDPQKIGEVMENKETIGRYGLYAGSGCVTYCGGNEENKILEDCGIKTDATDYDFNQTPIDEYDNAALRHDIAGSKIPDYKGHMKEPRALPSDRLFLKEVKDYRKRASDPKFTDVFTGRPQSTQAAKNAHQGLIYFKWIEIPNKVIFLPPPPVPDGDPPIPGGCTTRKICCFVPGTKVNVCIDEFKLIEDIIVGDSIVNYNFETKKLEKDAIIQISSPIQDSLINIIFSDGTSNTNTYDHPYFVETKGWSSFRPIDSKDRYNVSTEMLKAGDIILKNQNGKMIYTRIKSISKVNSTSKTYNIFTRKNHNYFANGILVYDETIIPKTSN